MELSAVFVARSCKQCGGTGKVQKGKQPFYTCAMCQGSGRKLIPAPDILDALKIAEKYIYGNGVCTCAEAYDHIRAAIAKAEGRE